MNTHLVAREHTLLGMLEALNDHDESTRIEDCDDCHAERALVAIDPDTYYCGEFVYCEECIKQKLAAIQRKKRKESHSNVSSKCNSVSKARRKAKEVQGGDAG